MTTETGLPNAACFFLLNTDNEYTDDLHSRIQFLSTRNIL